MYDLCEKCFKHLDQKLEKLRFDLAPPPPPQPGAAAEAMSPTRQVNPLALPAENMEHVFLVFFKGCLNISFDIF